MQLSETRIATLSFDLSFARYEIFPEERLVSTTFPDGRACVGSRDDNDQNKREAESQGYAGENAVWRSLVEHELLHSLVAEHLFRTESRVLHVESGGGFIPTWERYEEEMLCLALQYYLQTGDKPECLQRYNNELISSLVVAWRLYHGPVLSEIY